MQKEPLAGVKDAWDLIFSDFDPYMRECFERTRHVRILCERDKDIDLYSIYVNSNFSRSSETPTSDADLIQLVHERKNFVVAGNGGAGKTFFMRHLWQTLFLHPAGLTPLFIELRKLNELEKPDLLSFIRSSLSEKSPPSSATFSTFCEMGRFALILDGFDELFEKHRDAIQRQILRFSESFPHCSIVVSGRYDSRYSGWQSFDVFSSEPFTLEQTVELITKVPFEKDAKDLFLSHLNRDFYDQNSQFLSTPLLAIMMLMTFRDNLDIPNKLAVFYDRAFNTLFQWHDSTKTLSRERTLSIDDFLRSFSVFCLLSYYRERYEFSYSEAISDISRSSLIVGINSEADKVFRDYTETVNLMRQDGLTYVFIHRSFQEYFAAYAIVHVVPDRVQEVLPGIYGRRGDTVLLMCFQMRPSMVIDHYLVSAVSQITEMNLPFDGPPLKLLQEAGVEFGGVLLDSGDGGDVGLSVSLSSKLSMFIDNVAALRRGRPHRAHWRGEAESILMSGPAFNMAASYSGPTGVQVDFTVKFRDGGIVTTSDAGSNARAARALKSAISKNTGVFEELGKRLASEIIGLVEWSKSQIAARKSQAASLDDVFGPTSNRKRQPHS